MGRYLTRIETYVIEVDLSLRIRGRNLRRIEGNFRKRTIYQFVIAFTRVETGSNISTVTLRVVGGDEKGNLKSETVKYGRESQGTRTRERLRWQGSAACTKDRPVFSSERAPHRNKAVIVEQ
jgi:hypothetical protein